MWPGNRDQGKLQISSIYKHTGMSAAKAAEAAHLHGHHCHCLELTCLLNFQYVYLQGQASQPAVRPQVSAYYTWCMPWLHSVGHTSQWRPRVQCTCMEASMRALPHGHKLARHGTSDRDTLPLSALRYCVLTAVCSCTVATLTLHVGATGL